MFKNYLITAYKVLLRRKFFSFVNLFGIALTLAVLTVVVALLDSYLFPSSAEKNSGRFLEVSRLMLESEDRDSSWSSSPGYRFMQDYVRPMQTPTLISVYNEGSSANSFVDGQKYELTMKRTDGNYWKILQFDFIEGNALTDEDDELGPYVAVINQSTRRKLFNDQSALGKDLTVNGQTFEVVGVVRDESEISRHAFADVWVPVSTNPSTSYQQQMMDGFIALLMAESSDQLDAIRAEYRERIDDFEYDDPEQFAYAIGGADSKLDALAREVTNNWKHYDSGAGTFVTIVLVGMFLFMLLPTINMVNLNTSRILERASEIGVRKAFGASSATLVWQFIVENLVLTLVGGLLGFVLAYLLLDLVVASDLIKYADLHMNGRVFLASLLLIGFFGVLSGAYPAWRMSRMQPVAALKGA
ncbi:MAG: ABC transporter permease [Lysobacteraceae bacterium]|nr:MAG: ABC transporter permease [Xanthomonadaceae bacterium]